MQILQQRILRRTEVEATIGLGRSSIYAMMEAGSFPKPVRLGQRAVGWLEHEVQEWLKNRVLATRQGGVL